MEPNEINMQGPWTNNAGAFPAETPLAMAYVPVQKIHYVYDPNNALMQGTTFPELDKPFLDGHGMNKMADPAANVQMQSNISNKVNTDIMSGTVKPSAGNILFERGFDK